MKKILLLLVASIAFITLPAQVTQKQADEIVVERLSSETQPYTVYAKEGVQMEMIITSAATGETILLDYACWVYFVKYTDDGRYLIINESNGNLLEVNAKGDAQPANLEEWRLIALGEECSTIGINENEYVTMQFVPEKVSINSSNILRIENRTEGVINYFNPFFLEYFNNNRWERIYLSGNWTGLGYALVAGETTEEQMNLYSLIEVLNDGKKGTYRIIYEFTISHHFPSHTIVSEFTLCTGFEIE